MTSQPSAIISSISVKLARAAHGGRRRERSHRTGSRKGGGRGVRTAASAVVARRAGAPWSAARRAAATTSPCPERRRTGPPAPSPRRRRSPAARRRRRARRAGAGVGAKVGAEAAGGERVDVRQRRRLHHALRRHARLHLAAHVGRGGCGPRSPPRGPVALRAPGRRRSDGEQGRRCGSAGAWASCRSQKRSASCAYWLAWVCSRLLVATWSPLVALRMIAARVRPITASISIAMISEKPDLRRATARRGRRRGTRGARREKEGGGDAHSSLFCNTMVVVNVRRM